MTAAWEATYVTTAQAMAQIQLAAIRPPMAPARIVARIAHAWTIRIRWKGGTSLAAPALSGWGSRSRLLPQECVSGPGAARWLDGLPVTDCVLRAPLAAVITSKGSATDAGPGQLRERGGTGDGPEPV